MTKINANDVKREITEKKLKSGERLPVLSGFVRVTFSLQKRGGGQFELCLDCQTPEVRDYISGLIREEFKVTPLESPSVFAKGVDLCYGDGQKLLKALGIQKEGELFEFNGIEERFYKSAPSYARGMFLGCGSLSLPKAESAGLQKSGGYHLEFSFMTEELANDFLRLLTDYNVYGHLMLRSEKYVVYIKDNENVSDCLALIGADKTVLMLNESVAAFSVKGQVKRRVNCEIANMSRTVEASVGVTDAIDIIEKCMGLDKLDAKLREAARARKAYPQMPIGKLAEMLGISKSGLKHRFDRLIDFAKDISEAGSNDGGEA